MIRLTVMRKEVKRLGQVTQTGSDVTSFPAYKEVEQRDLAEIQRLTH